MDVQKNNNKVVGICLFIVIIILTFVYSYFVFSLYGDEIWCYGFSYNIYNGMIPYRDFSLVPTPLYFFIGSIFIKVFGEYLFSIHILNAILIGMIMIMLFKMIEWKSLLLYPLFLLFLVPTYNFLTLFFVFLVIYLISNKKDNDLILGFIVGLVFLTKQSIGIVMLIPLLFYSKKILKSICAFFIPVFILIIYLVWNDALFEFIDYCFLGMFDFNNNKVISIFTFFEIIQLVYLVVVLYKTKFRDKELFYILVYQIMSYPIFDLYHWLLSFIPFFYYIFKNFRYKEFRVSGQGWKKFIFISFILLLTFCCVFSCFFV